MDNIFNNIYRALYRTTNVIVFLIVAVLHLYGELKIIKIFNIFPHNDVHCGGFEFSRPLTHICDIPALWWFL